MYFLFVVGLTGSKTTKFHQHIRTDGFTERQIQYKGLRFACYLGRYNYSIILYCTYINGIIRCSLLHKIIKIIYKWLPWIQRSGIVEVNVAEHSTDDQRPWIQITTVRYLSSTHANAMPRW